MVVVIALVAALEVLISVMILLLVAVTNIVKVTMAWSQTTSACGISAGNRWPCRVVKAWATRET